MNDSGETAIAQDLSPDEAGFSRTLGTADLTILSLGAIVGAGIFVVSGTAAAQFAGPAITLSFVLAGVGCMAVGLCFAELAAMMPEVGGVYRYARSAFGEAVGWLMGWALIAEFLFGAATIAVSWSADLVAFCADMGVRLPWVLTQSSFAAEFGSQVTRVPGGGVNLPAVLLLVALTGVLAGGIRLTAKVNAAMVAIKLAVLVAIIVFGFSYVSSSNWHPYVPPNAGSLGRFGWSGVARGAAAVFFAFIGFDVLATVTQEAREPRRAVPVAIIGSVVICIVLYALMGAVITGLVPYRELNTPHPLLGIVGVAGSAAAVAGDTNSPGDHRRAGVGGFGVVARAAAIVVRDGTRRPGAGVVRALASDASRAGRRDDGERRGRGGAGRRRAPWTVARNGECRDAVLVRGRVPRRSDVALSATERPAPVPDSVGTDGAGGGAGLQR